MEKTTNPQFKEAAAVKAEFIAEGKTISQWARDNDFRISDVSRVLSGVHKGRRGKAHEIARRLGMK